MEQADEELFCTNNEFGVSRAAIHEAGHAVVALRLGHTVQRASLSRGNDMVGWVTWGIGEESTAIKQALIGIAGGIAETLTFGAHPTSYSSIDLDTAIALLERLRVVLPKVSLENLLEIIAPICSRILKDEFSVDLLFTIANVLDLYKSLEADELSFLVGYIEEKRGYLLKPIKISFSDSTTLDPIFNSPI